MLWYRRIKVGIVQYFIIIIILWAGVQPTLDPYAEAFVAGPLR